MKRNGDALAMGFLALVTGISLMIGGLAWDDIRGEVVARTSTSNP